MKKSLKIEVHLHLHNILTKHLNTLEGECTRGDSCRYSHDGASPRTGGGGGNTCYAFQRGECNRGDGCRFSHEGEGGGNLKI